MDLTVYITIVDCIFKSVKGQDIQNPCKICSGVQKLNMNMNSIGSTMSVYFWKKSLTQNMWSHA